MTDDAQLAALPRRLSELDAKVNLLVNNAGYAAAGPIEDVALDEVRRQFDVNFVGLIGVLKPFCLQCAPTAAGASSTFPASRA